MARATGDHVKQRALASCGLILAFVAAVVATVGVVTFSRSDVADEQVRRVASTVWPVLPRCRPLQPVRAAGFRYPVIERVLLTGVIEGHGPSSAPVPPARVLWRHATNPEAVLPTALALLLAAALLGAAGRWWAWPRVDPGRAPWTRARFLRFTLRLAVLLSPVAALCAAIYSPVVSLWGSAAWVALDQRGVVLCITDGNGTRALVAVGCALMGLWLSLHVVRRCLNAELRRGRLEGLQAPAGAGSRCAACGYEAGKLPVCPECGADRSASREVRLLWPHWLGRPPSRRGVAAGRVAVLTVAGLLLTAPLWVGVAMLWR